MTNNIPIDVTEEGIFNDIRLSQPENALAPNNFNN